MESNSCKSEPILVVVPALLFQDHSPIRCIKSIKHLWADDLAKSSAGSGHVIPPGSQVRLLTETFAGSLLQANTFHLSELTNIQKHIQHKSL